MTRNAPTSRILKNDYGSLLMVMVIGGSWVFAIAAIVFRFLPEDQGGGLVHVDTTMMTIMIAVAIVVSILFCWLVSKRIAVIKRIIGSGTKVTGKIQSIDFYKDRGRVEYDYEIDGKSYHAGTAIWKNNETKRLQPGDEISLLVDPDDPECAFIASLYT